MSHQRIEQLVNAIKSRQMKQHIHHSHILSSLGQAEPHQLQFQWRQSSKQYNLLLLDCLSLIELYEEADKSKARDYSDLQEQLVRERNDAACIAKQQQVGHILKQGHLRREQQRIIQMRETIANKQDQNMSLRAEIEQRQQRYVQVQLENRDNVLKIETIFNYRLTQQDKLNESKIQKLNVQLNSRIMELEAENNKFLQQNILLSSRLEQIMKHVEVLKQAESSPSKRNELSPKILHSKNFSNRSCNQFSASPKSSQNQLHRCLLINDQIASVEGRSGERMILHEIMNTEDRKSINFGYNCYSKPKQFTNESHDENINTLNQAEQQQQLKSKAKSLAVIKQFNARQTMTSYLGDNPYHIFFTIITQCAKINSENFEVAASLDVSCEWSHLLDSRVPLHEWYPFMLQQINRLISSA